MKKLALFLLMTFFVYSNESYQFHGSHFLASYTDCDEEALTNIDNLREALLLAAKESGATVLNYTDFVFAPNGFTMAILLSESHATIHTYPEHNACFVDLFTCGDHCCSDRFAKVLEKYLKPLSMCKKLLIRNQSMEEK